MHHYTGSTRQSITDFALNTEEGITIWSNYIPQLAFEHDFLLHGLLSLSSLHLFLSNRSESVVPAIRHHNLGLALFRPSLHSITADKADALFAFSCILSLFSFGIHRAIPFQLGPIEKICEALTLIRGAGVIVQSCKMRLLHDGPWKAWFTLEGVDLSEALPAEIEDVIAKLSRRISDTNFSTGADASVAIYSRAVTTLRHTLLIATRSALSQITVTLFPIMVRSEFFEMMSRHEPLALAILANYAVILHWMRNHIWLEGWGRQTIDAVRQALPHDWHDCIAWAVQEVEDENGSYRDFQRPAQSQIKPKPSLSHFDEFDSTFG